MFNTVRRKFLSVEIFKLNEADMIRTPNQK